MKISELIFTHDGPWFLGALFLAAAITAGIYYYRRTEPQVSPLKRAILGFLRGFALVILFLLIIQPVFGIAWESLVPPRGAVLIDESASMKITDRRGRRSMLIDSLLSGEQFRAFAEKFKHDIYTFGPDVRPFLPGDTLRWNRQGSDIASAIRMTAEKEEPPYDFICLISDGAYNLGRDPKEEAREAGIPVYTIAIGDSAAQNDISIHTLTAPEEAYAGKKISVQVRLRARGNAAGKATANLRHGERELESKTIDLPSEGRESSFSFEFVPEETGMQEYGISVSSSPGEITEDNNFRNFFLKVLKGKSRILLAGGKPSADFAFLFRALSGIQDFEVQSVLEQSPGKTYPSIPELDAENADIMVLEDFPTERSLGGLRGEIEKVLKSRSIPVLIVTGKTIAATAESFYSSLFGVTKSRLWNGEQEFFVRFAPGGEEHPIFRNDPALQIMKSVWTNLPPLFSDGEFLTGFQDERPVFVIEGARSGFGDSFEIKTMAGSGRKGNRKFFIINGFGTWRWAFYPQRNDASQEFHKKFIENIILWLSGDDERRYVIIKPEREVYESGDKIIFRGSVSDERYQLVDNARVRVILQDTSRTFGVEQGAQELVLEPRGKGSYEGALEMVDPGAYSYRGIVSMNDVETGSDSGRLFVSDFSMESMNPQRNNEVLKEIADIFGGRYYGDIHGVSLAPDIPFTLKRTIHESRWEFMNSAYLLGLVALSLSLEWFLRKKWGMM